MYKIFGILHAWLGQGKLNSLATQGLAVEYRALVLNIPGLMMTDEPRLKLMEL